LLHFQFKKKILQKKLILSKMRITNFAKSKPILCRNETNVNHLEKGEEQSKSREPRCFLLDDKGEFLDAAVEEGVARDRVPAFCGQRLLQVDVVARTVSAAATNL